MKENTNNTTEMLQKIFIGVVIVIVISLINTIILLGGNGTFKAKETSSGTNGSGNELVGTYDVSKMKEITPSELESNTKGKNTIVYIGRSTCSWCVQFVPVLNEIIDDYKIDMLYMDISKIDPDSKDYDKMVNLPAAKDFEDVMEDFGATPMTLVVKDGKIVNATVGYQKYEGFAAFVESVGFKK